jgi:uncharacterized membrane protein YoaK (UPF0700 family)
MTGIVSALANHAVLGNIALVGAGLCWVLTFMTGAATSAILINWGRRRGAQSEYAMPLMLEAILLLVFGLLGAGLQRNHELLMAATENLCFLMGLQNAIITKLSRAEIRTTHMTGVVTDIGIELGKLFYKNISDSAPEFHVRANRPRLRLLSSLLGMFLLGGLAGSIGFEHMGFMATVPLAAVLLVLAIVPVVDDLAVLRRRT